MAGEDDEEWLTPPKAAELRHLKPKTLREYRVSGTGPDFFKAGPSRNARVLYKRSDLKAWMEKCRFQSTSEYKKRGFGGIRAVAWSDLEKSDWHPTH